MGIAARAWVLEHYVEERVLALTADYYLSLLEAKSRSSTLAGADSQIESALPSL